MKAVESSTLVAFRALVMLACLVVAPLAAIFGSTFPDVVRAWLINPLVAHTASAGFGVDGAASPIGGAIAPPASKVSRDNLSAEGLTPFWQPPAMASSSNGPPPGAARLYSDSTVSPAPAYKTSVTPVGIGADAASNYSPAASRSATQAAFSAPVDTVAPGPSRFAATTPEPSVYATAPPGAGFGRAPAATSSVMHGATSIPAPAVQPANESEHFAWFEKKLREYGAAYYLLETWGNESELYRFHCKMAVAGNPNYTRHFEATDRDKLQAMAKVLEQVEAWRGGRLP